MKDMKYNSLRNLITSTVAADKYELPLYIFADLKSEIYKLLSKYFKLEKEDVHVNVQISKDGNYKIKIDCYSSNYMLNSFHNF